jgi:multidrug resistance efflux pump
MRFTRILVGVGVLAVALWILVGEQLAGVSADAVINARLTAVRAPIAGDVTLEPLALGARVQAGDDLGTVNDLRADAIRLDDLLMEQSLEQAAALREREIIAALEAQAVALDARTTAYRQTRIAEIGARLTKARARLTLLQAVSDAENNDLSATLGAGQSGNPGDPLLPGIALEYARERVAVLEIELAAAEDELFLGDGYNDAPWSEQWRANLDARLAEHRGVLAEVEARQAAVAARISDERLRVNRLASAQVVTPVSGLIWELRSATGENVQRGDELLKMVDCASVLVTLSVTESIYNDLTLGDRAVFRLQGDRRLFEGTIARLAGSGAETVYRNLAVAPSQKHLQRFDVALAVPSLADDPELSCAIGRTGRAFFDTRPLDWLRR